MRILLVSILLAFVMLFQGCASSPLISAINSGDLVAFKSLVNSENLDQSHRGLTPLMYAAKVGNLEIIKYLLDKGANINSQDDYGYTALHYAVEDNKLDAVKLLIEKKANINLVDKDGNTILMTAANAVAPEIFQYLFEKGADINTANNYGNTPLLVVAQGNEVSMLKILLANSVNLNKQNKDGLTAFMYAVAFGNNEVTRILAKESKVDFSVKDNYGNSALHIAALTMGTRYHNAELLKFLLDKTNDINAKNNLGCTPLLLSAMCGSKEGVDILLMKRADPSIPNNDKMTALDYASQFAKEDPKWPMNPQIDMKFLPYYSFNSWNYTLKSIGSSDFINYPGVVSTITQVASKK